MAARKDEEKWTATPSAVSLPSESFLPHAVPQAPPATRRRTVMTLLQMALFYTLAVAVMGAHLSLFQYLDGTPVRSTRLTQSIENAMASFMALVAELLLVSGVSIAYTQLLWRFFRQKTLSAFVIDKLVSLPDSPWDLARPRVIISAIGPWLAALVCVLMPLAGMFPPGCLTVEFRNSIVPVTLSAVPTLNISYWGPGNYRGFVDHALFDLNADLDFINVQPKLTTLARTVLAQGEPVAPPTPCSGPCTYDMQFDGPSFECKQVNATKYTLFKPCTDVVFKAKSQSVRDGLLIRNNSVRLSWHTERNDEEACRNSTLRTMDCSVKLATYNVKMTNEENGTRIFNTKVTGEREFWDDENPVPLRFYDYFYDRESGNLMDEAVNQTQLHKLYANTQAYAIREAAVQALVGDVRRFSDGGGDTRTALLWPNMTYVVGSPYIGMTDRFNPQVSLTPETVQKYLQDIVISTLSLNPKNKPLWTNGPDIPALEGGATYIFDSKLQFFLPYGVCLLVAALVYIHGIWAMWKNGQPAGKSLLQFATAVSTSKTLQDTCSSRTEGDAFENIKEIKLRYGVGRSFDSAGSIIYVTGFGTVDEVDCTK
ncbi:hypothetical protein BN1723_010888 [Verticillium longisporum]|uniref:Uncharacterized protein n=1 Tax=Verticillium longisporum TaxID=100787 RepID=A0A0G4L2G6_VERLO|nr:hypothetical protein HYQ44_004317 [Verticillium longisporum]CRK16204.1 hypothetical protein BN1723_010888 [Verticillium longisporum]CRK28304.1 hypothetical protein BN1708_015183 [Verticillium longisporum]